VEEEKAIGRGQDRVWNAAAFYPIAGKTFLEILNSGVGG
jgi:hypothetical protein